ncbi:MAG TPA: Dabb family protein [Methanobacterium sp.]|nr:Dabb family protein [Methanobacterium sp.]
MKGKIPELKDIEVGIDITHSDRSYNLALITKFESINDLEVYQGYIQYIFKWQNILYLSERPR